jgi:hypothetical protein
MPAIRQFLFVSRLSGECTFNDIIRIVSVSRENNMRDGISGLMYFDGQYFCHYLEGAPRQMSELSARILADTRHQDVMPLLEREMGTVRLYEDWRIGFSSSGASAAVQRLTMLRDEAALVAFLHIQALGDFELF